MNTTRLTVYKKFPTVDKLLQYARIALTILLGVMQRIDIFTRVQMLGGDGSGLMNRGAIDKDRKMLNLLSLIADLYKGYFLYAFGNGEYSPCSYK